MDAIFDMALEAGDIEVPQDLVDAEVEMMAIEQNHRMKYESLASGSSIVLTQEEMAARLDQIKAEAFKLVKTRLVLRRIIEAEDFDVTREELEEEAKAISLRQRMPIEMVKSFLGEDLASLKEDLLVRKAIDFASRNELEKQAIHKKEK
jgi:FKBP-type peptidyl-prolyl cis-trans isomerase (trigger factor)